MIGDKLAALRDGFPPGFQHLIAVVGMHGLQPRQSSRLFGGQAGLLAPAVVDITALALQVGHEDADRKLLGQASEALFVIAQGFQTPLLALELRPQFPLAAV